MFSRSSEIKNSKYCEDSSVDEVVLNFIDRILDENGHGRNIEIHSRW